MQATFLDKDGKAIAKSPSSYCPTCAVAIGAARTPLLAKQIRDALKDAPNTGQKKFEMNIENRYIVKGGGAKVTLAKGEVLLAKNVRGCCMAYGTAKAEIVARIPGQEAEGRGTLCSLSALTNMLLRGDAQKILRPSGTRKWESE